MRRIFAIFIIVAIPASLTLSSCNFNCRHGSGKLVTETRSVSDFTGVDISGGYKVIIKQDSVTSLKITADDNLIQSIKTDVSGSGKLKIHSPNICSSGQYVINISIKNLNYFRASGAIDLVSDGKITTKDLELNLSGATKVNLDINADNVVTSGSGLTDMTLTGQAKSHSVDLSGSGTLNALDFVVNKYSIRSSGASHCKINVLNVLDVSSSGASDIEYRGNPSTVNNSKSGASSLQKIN